MDAFFSFFPEFCSVISFSKWTCSWRFFSFFNSVKAPLALLVCQARERQPRERQPHPPAGSVPPASTWTHSQTPQNNEYLSQERIREVFFGSHVVLREHLGFLSSLWAIHLPTGRNGSCISGRYNPRAVPQPLAQVQSRRALKDSHRYPTLTRCHCRDPMITISAPHETFMACWQWESGMRPNF